MKTFSTLLFFFILFPLSLSLSACKKSDSSAVVDPVTPPVVKLTGILSTLQQAHPRLLLTDTRLQELKSLSFADTRLKKYADAGEKFYKNCNDWLPHGIDRHVCS